MKTLSPREEELMDLMWKHGPMFVNEMLEHFAEPRPHFNTISTFMRSICDCESLEDRDNPLNRSTSISTLEERQTNYLFYLP